MASRGRSTTTTTTSRASTSAPVLRAVTPKAAPTTQAPPTPGRVSVPVTSTTKTTALPSSQQQLSDRRGTTQLKRAELTLQEKNKALEEQLEQTRAQHTEEIKRLQLQLEAFASKAQVKEDQEEKIRQLEEEKVQLQRTLEAVGYDSISKRRVAAQDSSKVIEVISSIRERVRGEGSVLKEIQESVKTSSQLLTQGEDDMEFC